MVILRLDKAEQKTLAYTYSIQAGFSLRHFLSETSKTKIINHLLVLVIALLGFSQKKYDLEEMTVFQRVVVEVTTPIQNTLFEMRQSFNQFTESYVRIVNTGKENAHLKAQITRLEADLFMMEEMRRENERLKQLLNYSSEMEYDKLLARVIGWDSTNQFKVLRISRGEKDGVQMMSPVITHKGLVGYVYRLGKNFSDVLTILDPNNRVDAVIDRTRTHGIVEGIFNEKCQLKYINKDEQIAVGDKLISAGVGGLYPKGIKIGIITSIDRETSDMTLSVEVKPSVEFNKLEEVIILTPKSPKAALLFPSDSQLSSPDETITLLSQTK